MPTCPPEVKPQDVLLIIADISGYTQFMLENQMELVHRHWVITQLLDTIIGNIRIPLHIVEVEGDAVFFYALMDAEQTGSEQFRRDVTSKLRPFFDTFADKLVTLSQSVTCQCNACRHLDRLRLKLIIHSGQAVFYEIEGMSRLSGPDVIIAHRLLKNSVAAREYLLATEAAYQDLILADQFDLTPDEEYYDGIGTVGVYLHLPRVIDDFVQTLPDPTSLSLWQQLKTRYSLPMHLLRSDWGWKNRPDFSSPPGGELPPSPRRWFNADAFTGLRVALGVVFIIGGITIGFPTDPEALAQKYTHPTTGFIAPLFATWITETLGLSISRFLQLQGGLEIVTGIAMIRGGLMTQMVAIMMATMLWLFTVASPVLGQIRLSRDLALAGLCIAVALTGPGGRQLDGALRYRDGALRLIRLSLAYTLIMSALFISAPLDNPLNTTLPLGYVLGFGGLLILGVFPRGVMFIVSGWLLIVLGSSVYHQGFYLGVEGVKREIGLLAGSLVYGLTGPDRWALWRGRRHKRGSGLDC